MTTLTLSENIKLPKTNFINMVDLYNFIIDNQIITEVGSVDIDNLNDSQKELFEKSKDISNLINI